ncbi:GNAT family N-acetyltransferase [Niveispirillum fermenti]|uniref:GNAT family N-acetyltransferase n=1 Tax=Niveispirillum fermenti TaxID=1233113 RepID=UPI003A83E461
MKLQAQVINTQAGLEAIRTDWQHFVGGLADNALVYASWDYIHAYLSFQNQPGWLIVVFREAESGAIVAIHPLTLYQVTVEGRTFRACRPIGVAYLPFMEFPLRMTAGAAVTRSLVQEVLFRALGVEIVFLGPLQSTSPTYVALLETMPAAQMKVLSITSYSHIDGRAQSFQDYCRGRKTSTIRDAERCERRLREAGRLDYHAPDMTEDPAGLARRLCALSEGRFSGNHLYATRPEWRELLPHLMTRLQPAGMMEACSLRLDGRAIALCVNFRHKGRHSYHMAAFDPAYARFSPSKVLMAHLIRRAFAERALFCFGGGIYDYKEDWCHTVGDARVPVLFADEGVRAAVEPLLTMQLLSQFIGRQ